MKPVHRTLMRWFIGITCVLIGMEAAARSLLGLGDPPLMVADAEIEYRMRPGHYRRFGNDVRINSYSMRSDPISRVKDDPNEVRVLFIGDSVIYGGNQIDQAAIASELIRGRLQDKLHRPVVVGNASARSWGPPNMLAYVNHYGLFDADIVVVVLSSHDAEDVPTGEPVVDVNPDCPGRTPFCALSELIMRYGRRLFPASEEVPPPNAQKEATAALRKLIEIARSRGCTVIVAQNLERDEQIGREKPGHDVIKRVAEEAGAAVVQLGPEFRRKGSQAYLDHIHGSSVGQACIADALTEPILSAVKAR